MILAEHTWVPVLPEWVVELQPLLVLGGLIGGVFVLWQMVLTTFEPHKRWKQFRHKDEETELMGSGLPLRQPGTVAIEEDE